MSRGDGDAGDMVTTSLASVKWLRICVLVSRWYLSVSFRCDNINLLFVWIVAIAYSASCLQFYQRPFQSILLTATASANNGFCTNCVGYCCHLSGIMYSYCACSTKLDVIIFTYPLVVTWRYTAHLSGAIWSAQLRAFSHGHIELATTACPWYISDYRGIQQQTQYNWTELFARACAWGAFIAPFGPRDRSGPKHELMEFLVLLYNIILL